MLKSTFYLNGLQVPVAVVGTFQVNPIPVKEPSMYMVQGGGPRVMVPQVIRKKSNKYPIPEAFPFV